MEIYKDIPGYEGLYKVSNIGNILNIKRNRNKKTFLKRGYLSVSLSNPYKQFAVHQLVAMAFLNHIPDGTYKLVVDHINNNKLDNSVNNLQIVTARINSTKDRIRKNILPTGVVKNGKKYASNICINGKPIYLGNFNTIEEASNAYQNMLTKIAQ